MTIAGRDLPYRKGYEYGVGVIAGTGFRAGMGVTGAISGVQGSEGGSEHLTITQIETTEDLESSLGISAEATGGCGLFEANARFDFAKNCEIHSRALTLVVSHIVDFGFQQIDIPKLTETAGALAQRPEDFQTRYGDLFVSGISSGGLFFGVIVIEYSSEKSRQDISSAMSGSYALAFSADVALQLKNALATSRSSARIRIYSEGGTLRGKEHPRSPQDLLEAHSVWYNSLVGPDGRGTALKKPYSVQALPYTIAEGPEGPNSADLQRQLDVLARCASLRSSYLDTLNLVSYVSRHADFYEFVDGTVDYLSQAQASLGSDLQHIGETASYAKSNPAKAQWPEVYNAPEGGYRFTVLDPGRMPLLKSSVAVETPDLSRCTSEADAKSVLSQKGLTLQIITDSTQEGDFKVLAQEPAAAEASAAGGVVTIVVPKSTFKLFINSRALRGDLIRGYAKGSQADMTTPIKRLGKRT